MFPYYNDVRNPAIWTTHYFDGRTLNYWKGQANGEIRLYSTPEALPRSDALVDWRSSWSRTSELPTDPDTAILSTEDQDDNAA
jgi:hypothetical protein